MSYSVIEPESKVEKILRGRLGRGFPDTDALLAFDE